MLAVIKRLALFGFVGFVGLPLLSCAQFWDQGFVDGAARSDFATPYVGTWQSPVVYGECLFPGALSYPCTGNNWWDTSNLVSFGYHTYGVLVFHSYDDLVMYVRCSI